MEKPQLPQYFTVYKITSKSTGEFYIGVHTTSNLEDGYMGSGNRIRRAIYRLFTENNPMHKEANKKAASERMKIYNAKRWENGK